ncbi:MAG: hypothetical protein V2A66_01755 [Pseudomonadota bacterium]
MNNLAYSSQKPEEVASKVEELLRKELNSQSPIQYQIEDEGASRTSLGSILKESAGLLLGGREEVKLFTIVFNITQPRPITLRVHLNKQGIGCHAGSLLYTSNISKPVSGEASLEEPKMLGASKFKGATDVAEKLNGNKDLLKLCGKFARTEGNSGGIKLTVPRICKVVPAGAGTMLVINTLPRPTSMGFGAAMDAKDFFSIAELVEKAL